MSWEAQSPPAGYQTDDQLRTRALERIARALERIADKLPNLPTLAEEKNNYEPY